MVFETEIKPKIDNQTHRHEPDRHTDTNQTDLVAFRAREGTVEEKERREGEEGEGEIGEIPKLITFCLLGVTLPAARETTTQCIMPKYKSQIRNQYGQLLCNLSLHRRLSD